MARSWVAGVAEGTSEGIVVDDLDLYSAKNWVTNANSSSRILFRISPNTAKG
jgi:hypothetical protein